MSVNANKKLVLSVNFIKRLLQKLRGWFLHFKMLLVISYNLQCAKDIPSIRAKRLTTVTQNTNDSLASLVTITVTT